ncbi:MAG: RNA polymerase factor sigma-54 [Deltaproteobacteria bacterium]|nr:RNA polymerase factor sigma-54 [Deltaproteobacteria bacterium]
MALELRQQLKLSQQLIMTPQLQLAIKLLQLSRLELLETIHQELQENPALEETMEDATTDQTEETPEIIPADIGSISGEISDLKTVEDTDWSSLINEYSSSGRVTAETEKKDAPNYESFIAQKESLQDHLSWQLLMTFPDTEVENLGSLIIGNLNADGYLELSLDELVLASRSSSEKAIEVLQMLQTFDPIGVCSRDLRECLLIQARHLNLEGTPVVDIITNHLNHLERKNYKAISKALKLSIEDIVSAVDIIKGLEPRPGRLFSSESPQYITPDIYVYKVDDDFVVVLNDDGMPKLKVNSFYKDAIQHKKNVSNQTRDYVQEKMRSATWLIRSIHQRQKTIYKVMESILRYQREFFEKGILHLKPMVLRDIADDIGMHESTISRVTTNKYAHTPQGIFELKFFFNSSINRMHGEAIASASVLNQIKQIIGGEDQKNPYSDQQLSEILEAANIKVARRTVAKYREMLKVLPSSRRRQF